MVNGSRDIGAFESQGFDLTVTGGSGQVTSINQDFADPLSVTISSAFGEPVVGGTITFIPPETGATAVLSSDLATVDAGGEATTTAAANFEIGNYGVIATTAGVDAPVILELTNGFLEGVITVDTLVDENDGDFATGDTSLREAVMFTGSGGTINFNPALSGGAIALELGELVLDRTLTINGLGAENLAVSGNNASRVFRVTGTTTEATLQDLSITEGIADVGGGIRVEEGSTLTLANSEVVGNSATGAGAGLFSDGTVQITNTTLDSIETGVLGSTILSGSVTTLGNQIFRHGVTAAADLDLEGAAITATETWTAEGGLTLRATRANTGDVTLNGGSSDLTFSSALVGGNLTVTTLGNVSGNARVAGQTNVSASVNTLETTLEDPVVISSGSDLTVTGAGTVNLSTLPELANPIAGNVDVVVTGTDVFVSNFAGVSAISLTGEDNQFGGTLTVITDLPSSAGEPPVILQSTPLTILGTLNLNATETGNIILSNSGNQFGVVEAIADTVSLTTAGDVALGASDVGSNLTVTAAGDIRDRDGLFIGGTATLNANSGIGNITVDSENNQFGSLELTGNTVFVRENDGTNLGLSTINDTLTVDSGGAIVQSGTATVAGTTTLNAGEGTGNIFLEADNNQFGRLELTGKTVAVQENGLTTLGPSNITEDLRVTAGDVQVNPGLVVNGDLLLQPLSEEQDISIGLDTEAFSLDQNDVAHINAAMPATVTIGSPSSSGTMTWIVDGVDPFDAPLQLLSPAGAVNIVSSSAAIALADGPLLLSDLTVNAETITLAAAGNITLDTVQLLGSLPTGSTITIDSGLTQVAIRQIELIGPGLINAPIGLVNIFADTIDATASINSDIIAGDVAIASTFNQTLLNIALQTQPTPNSDIISTGFFQDPSGFDPSQGTIELDISLEDVTNRIRVGCGLGNTSGTSQFIITGRGGLSPSHSDAFTANSVDVPWVTYEETPEAIATPPQVEDPPALIEAQQMVVGTDGIVRLTPDVRATDAGFSGQIRGLCTAQVDSN